MLSLFKILLTVAVIYAVWFGFKYRRRIGGVHKRVADESAREEDAANAARKPGEPVAQDLVPCPKCGSYIPAGTACSCEKV